MTRRKGFTLIELLISTAIFAVIMVSLYFAFSTGTFGFRSIEENTETFQAALNTLGRLNSDLRNSFLYTPTDSGFEGDENKISFFTLVNSENGITKDFARVTYLVEKDSAIRFMKRNKDALNDNKIIPPYVIANNIKEIKFSYLFLETGNSVLKEKNSWVSADGVLLAVRVTLTMLKDAGKVFSRTIYLPVTRANE